MGTEPNICPEHNVPVFRARRSYHCDCETCQGPAEREVEPTEEEVKKQQEREERAENVREATRTTYNSGPAANTVSEEVVEGMNEILEGDDG